MEYPTYLHQPSPESRSSSSTSSFTLYSPSTRSTGSARGTACDQCHRCKVRCSGHTPSCERCSRYNNACTYSLGKPLGKPKGRKHNTPKHAFRQHDSRNSENETSRESTRTPDESTDRPQERSNRLSPLIRPKQHLLTETPFEPGAINLNPLNFFGTNDFDTTIGTTSYPLDAFTGFEMPASNQMSTNNTTETQHDRFPLVLRNGNPLQSSKPEAQQHFDSRLPRSTASLSSSRLTSGRANIENAASLDETGGNLPLQLITQLQNQHQSVAWAPINSTLTIARQGLDAVSRYMSGTSSPSEPAYASPSLLIACLLILQLSLSCYIELGPHAAKRFEQNGTCRQADAETLCVGGFTIEDSESCRSVLDALVSAERKRGRTILVRLRQVARELKAVGEDKTGLLELLLESEEGRSRGNSYQNLVE